MRRSHQPQLLDRIRLEAFIQQFGVGKGVCCIGMHAAARGGLAGTERWRSGWLAANAPVPVAVRRLAHEAFGPELPDSPCYVTAQLDARGEPTVGITEEDDRGHAHLACGSTLFLLAQLGHVLARDGAIRTAGIAVGHYAVRDLDTRFDPRGNRARGAEIDIVRVRGNDEHALDPGWVIKRVKGALLTFGDVCNSIHVGSKNSTKMALQGLEKGVAGLRVMRTRSNKLHATRHKPARLDRARAGSAALARCSVSRAPQARQQRPLGSPPAEQAQQMAAFRLWQTLYPTVTDQQGKEEPFFPHLQPI